MTRVARRLPRRSPPAPPHDAVIADDQPIVASEACTAVAVKGGSGLGEHVIRKCRVRMVSQHVATTRASHDRQAVRLTQGLSDRATQPAGLDRVVEGMHVMQERPVALDPGWVDDRHRPARRRLVVAEAVVGEALRRPDHPGRGGAPEELAERQPVLGEVDAHAVANKPFQLGDARNAQRGPAFDLAGKEDIRGPGGRPRRGGRQDVRCQPDRDRSKLGHAPRQRRHRPRLRSSAERAPACAERRARDRPATPA